jgi:hypothetical protein
MTHLEDLPFDSQNAAGSLDLTSAPTGLHFGTVFGACHSRMGALPVMQLGLAKFAESAIREVAKKFDSFPKMPAILIHGLADKIVRPVNLAQLTQQFRMSNDIPAENQSPEVLKAAKTGSRNQANAYRTP